MARRKPIYVESLIEAPIDELWNATQDPDLHQRWDVRFGQIEYLPRVDGEPQRFRYTTKVAPGVTIAGTGESLGDRDRPDGSRWSGLKFWAGDRRSIIDAGAGLLALRAGGRRRALPHPLRLPAAFGARWASSSTAGCSVRCSAGRRRGASTACASGWRTARRPSCRATWRSPMPAPRAPSPVPGSTTAWSPSCSWPTPPSRSSGDRSGSARPRRARSCA